MQRSKLMAAFLCAGLAFGAVALNVPSVFAAEPAKQKDKGDKGEKPKGDKAEAEAKVGSNAPTFTLTSTDGQTINLAEAGKGKIVVLEWFNPDCPFVVKHHKKNPTFKTLYKEFADKGVVFLAINSGAAGKQGAGQERNVKAKADYAIEYPVLLDTDGSVGRLYGAKTTPHMYIIDKDGKLVYNGAIDNNRDADKPGDKNYVRQALNELLEGKPVSEAETRPYGCSVKY